tara:strand:+ start:98014 stop:98649 length:636 start_codon:yes stop_codon:yes gene_type:complete
MRLTVGPQVWTVADNHLVVATQGKRKTKTRSIRLGEARLYVARAWPTNEVSLWLEQKDGVVQRLLGLPPMPGMNEGVIKAWRDLEQLATMLQEGLSDYGAGVQACELGTGGHRVFTLHYPSKLVVFARKVFRENLRRIVELREDGSLALAGRRRDRIIPMRAGMEVIARGDRVNFCKPDGEQVAGIFLPWIGDADRVELSRWFQALSATQQ